MTQPIRQVLVHLDATQGAAARLQAGRALAQDFGSSLTVLYAASPSFVELPYTPEIGQGFAAKLVEIDNERRDRALGAVRQCNARPGAVAAWAETGEVPIIGAFVQQALYADMLVLGQRDASDPLSVALPGDFNEAVIMGSGKPALVVPYTGWKDPIGKTVVVAWKQTRESARALSAAMPILQRAGQVHVLAWAEESPAAVQGERLDLDGYLRLHGIEAKWHHGGPEPAQLGEVLLSRAFDLQADLLVMGCYGHNRAREWVMGGASRTILASLTLPVLMAH